MMNRFEAREMNGWYGVWGVWDNVNESWLWDNFARTEWKSFYEWDAKLKAMNLNNKKAWKEV